MIIYRRKKSGVRNKAVQGNTGADPGIPTGKGHQPPRMCRVLSLYLVYFALVRAGGGEVGWGGWISSLPGVFLKK